MCTDQYFNNIWPLLYEKWIACKQAYLFGWGAAIGEGWWEECGEDNAINYINHNLVVSMVCFVNTYPLDSDLSRG